MKRLSPSTDTIRALFAKSGNRCSFPGCKHPLINNKNQFVAQIAHVKGVKPNSERYDSLQTDEERRSYNNLVMLCYAHHVEIDSAENEYTVEKILEIKARHEILYSQDEFIIPESTINTIQRDTEKMWNEYQQNIENIHPVPNLSISFDTKLNQIELVQQIRFNLNVMHSYIGESPLNNWEIQNIALPNIYTKIISQLLHLELKVLESTAIIDPKDETISCRLDDVRKEIVEWSRNVGFVD